mmetsp:Transcript_9062/g.27231  ORF Transcript_9062/g.27231 Transcript_9062/m.27231 type:complete len:365 (-) Transcript_9062:773-1867(-)|eukprot:CAMPEP_0198735278 /NCGR_PEP_ID=MMETSP1475-20131203/58406_1 /TAXON_ID= ORGANISM="Unidentified sp., Strain CCMP1999" /NCGR_SAMPLE_ID=MMETSP1475 /ASSEMBLY_ACC=CAM_ASM_001111 /LENGTH=364 /DNA_ID=CAMNT_0044498907 /DNA_START=95 /DNA_END=1189 /DNA_ORIENTATION=+
MAAEKPAMEAKTDADRSLKNSKKVRDESRTKSKKQKKEKKDKKDKGEVKPETEAINSEEAAPVPSTKPEETIEDVTAVRDVKDDKSEMKDDKKEGMEPSEKKGPTFIDARVPKDKKVEIDEKELKEWGYTVWGDETEEERAALDFPIKNIYDTVIVEGRAARWNGEIIAKTAVWREIDGHTFFPRRSVKKELIHKTKTKTFSAWLGLCEYSTVTGSGKKNENAAFQYNEPKKIAEDIARWYAFWRGVKIDVVPVKVPLFRHASAGQAEANTDKEAEKVPEASADDKKPALEITETEKGAKAPEAETTADATAEVELTAVQKAEAEVAPAIASALPKDAEKNVDIPVPVIPHGNALPAGHSAMAA